MEKKYVNLKYTGNSCVPFENGSTYKAVQTYDDGLKDCYSIKDESDEWYLYGKEYVDENFVVVD